MINKHEISRKNDSMIVRLDVIITSYHECIYGFYVVQFICR